MSDLLRVLEAFSKATHCEAAVGVKAEGTGPPRAEARTASAPDLPTLPRGPSPEKFVVRGDELRVAAVPGPRAAWLAVGPCKSPGAVLDQLFDFLLPVVTQYIQSALEVEHAANELAERYEEINLLYSISEILGRPVTLEETARTILGEISDTVGARRGAILVLDRASEALRPVAVLGADVATVPPIPLGDQTSISAKVFRSLHSALVEDGDAVSSGEQPYRRGAMLSVPIMWTAPRGSEPLGVVNLSDRRSGRPLTAWGQKLMFAIAPRNRYAAQNARPARAPGRPKPLPPQPPRPHRLHN